MEPGRAVSHPRRRALVLAGGGLKVAYQAGVLQVLLDEAGLDFDLANGASGGVFNLAMWCQGMTGQQIADNWRSYRPLRAFTPNLGAWLRGPWGASLLTFGGLRARVLPAFGLDWHAIRTTCREATFELFDVSRQELRSVMPAEMTEDLLLSAVALPMWFPPVRVDGDTYIDAVFATDANLEEMIRRGATELWVIWTVSTRGRWRPGFVPEYFLMIEAAANSRLRAVLHRIERNNADIAAGRAGEFGRQITVCLLTAEVPVHYLLSFRRETVARAVDLGVRDARAWCVRHGIMTVPASPCPPPAEDVVRFHELMTGSVAAGTAPGGDASRMSLDLDVVVRDVRRFVANPGHPAQVYGTLRCAAFGGQLAIHSGTCSLLADASGTGGAEKRMTYDLRVNDAGGRALHVHGVKRVRHDARLDLWADTTTLATEVRDEATGCVLAAGVLRLSLSGFLRQLTTFRAAAPTPVRRLGALAEFGGFFADQLWQVYGRRPVRPAALQAWLRKAVR
jgi:predicted acylesterase/phospholipase RssA